MSAAISNTPTAAKIREHLKAHGSSAKCPAHDDGTASLSINEGEDGKALLNCHAGCSQSAVIEALQERGIWPKANGLTVHDLAAAKSLPYALLVNSGFADDEIRGRPVVRIDYRDADGKILCVRYRGGGDGPRFWFRKGDKQQLFGLHRLRREDVIIVEGETDAVALWSQNYNAIGVPGADAWRDDRFAQHLANCPTINVHIEPDEGGEKFRAKFEQSSLRDRVRFFTVPGAKDPCELHARDPEGFCEKLEAAIANAQPVMQRQLPAPTLPAPAKPTIILRSAHELANTIFVSWWLIKPYIERNASILLFGDLGTLKSFLALHWALEAALAGHTVVYLSAEGKGLGRRIKGWARHRWDEEWSSELAKIPFFGIERPLNLSAAGTVSELVLTMETGAIEPALIVVDTVSKNSDGRLEQSTEDATAYLNQMDQELRAKYEATVILVHHTGHQEKNRARGPYVLMANTDANFRVDRPDLSSRVITVTAGRMKDTEEPPPFSMEGQVVETGDMSEEGTPITTVILVPADTVVFAAPKRPTGKAQKAILTALERRQRETQAAPVWTIDEIRTMAKELTLSKSTARDAIRSLTESGFLKQTIGGLALGYQP